MTRTQLHRQLEELMGERVAYHVPMREWTTWRVGGPADCLVRPETAEEVAKIVTLCLVEKTPVRVVGAGSNLLVLDGGLRGVTILLRQGFDDFCARVRRQWRHVDPGGGSADANGAVARAADEGWSGLEFIAGVPGSIAAACG